jgi:hypothetical protein
MMKNMRKMRITFGELNYCFASAKTDAELFISEIKLFGFRMCS